MLSPSTTFPCAGVKLKLPSFTKKKKWIILTTGGLGYHNTSVLLTKIYDNKLMTFLHYGTVEELKEDIFS